MVIKITHGAIQNAMVKRHRVRRPKKMIFICNECGSVHNYLPTSCKSCNSMHIEEKVIGHFNTHAL